ncbi:MAG TPA: hypothetical protein ENI87_06870 [bacterium]|nr:hypothetical protein [bacterium]
MDLQRVRIRTTFWVSVVASPFYVAAGMQAWSREIHWVAAGTVVGLVLCIWTGFKARKVTAGWRPPWPIGLFLLVFLTAVTWSGYGGGYGVAWLVCVPPLALLIHGTRTGSVLTAVMFVVLVIGLANDSMVAPATVSDPFRLRFGAAYLLIAATCITYSAATDWYGRRLDEASEEVASLRALLTMCSHCKRVRIDAEWRAIEAFLDQEKRLRISHSICPRCVGEHYPELVE